MTGRAGPSARSARSRSSPSSSGSSSGSSRSGTGGGRRQAREGRAPRRAGVHAEPARRAGRELSLADLQGKPVVVNFWASWCGPCKGEAPALQKTCEKYRWQGLVLVGIDAQDFRGDAKRFAKRYGVTYPIVYDG